MRIQPMDVFIFFFPRENQYIILFSIQKKYFILFSFLGLA